MTIPTERISRLAFQALNGPPQHDHNGRATLRLNMNESPFQPSPIVKEAVIDAASRLNYYPDGEAEALLSALSNYVLWPKEKIFVGAGSNELLFSSAEIALNPGDEMIAPVPAFPTYQKLAVMHDAVFVGVPVKPNGQINIDAMLKAVSERTRLMFVSAPHNPTGTLLTQSEIARLCADLPDHVLLHFDEAYFEFGKSGGAPDALPILSARNGPWIATRTFSKAFGLAGARVGYGLAGSPAVARAIRKTRPNFSLSQTAMAAGIAALNDLAHARSLVDYTLSEANRMRDTLWDFGLFSFESSANFISILPPPEMEDLARRLKELGIYTLGFKIEDREAVRITIGSKEANDRVLDTLRSILE